MPIADLTPHQRDIVGRCLRVAADRPDLFPEWEFSTIFGLSRPELGRIADRWPDIDETQTKISCAINNAMNNLLGYPHIWQKNWAEHLDFTPRELVETFHAWRGDKPRNYFEGMV